MLDRLRKILLWSALGILLAPPIGLVAFRIVPPPVTPLMLIRSAEGEGLTRTWKPLGEISPQLRAAVIASEDNLFCTHNGFDIGSIQDAMEDREAGRGTRGASTISMQTAKNLFLWPGRNLVRKGLEAYVTLWMEFLWPKSRIAEVYLNIAEWGPGLYGAEAAAQAYFRKPAASLTRRDAALLAAVLPNPRAWSPAKPTPYIQGRAQIIQRRMTQVGPALLDCVGGEP
jgi:monofunctional glycosyltransferase